MKFFYYILILLAVTIISTGCSTETLDKINPSLNNSWGMLLQPDSMYRKLEDDSSSENVSGNLTISKGDSTATINPSTDMENDVVSSTLDDDRLSNLTNIGSSIESTTPIPIVNPEQVHAAAYIDTYLNPKITSILNTINSSDVIKNYPSLYFKVLYCGLDKTDDGEQKWVTYSKSYQNIKDSSFMNSDNATIIALLSRWDTLNKTVKNTYFTASNMAKEFGEQNIKNTNGSFIAVKNCSREQLLQFLPLEDNVSIQNKYINYYLSAIASESNTSKYNSYSSYLNSYHSSLDTSYSAAANTADHIVSTLPSFVSPNLKWISYATKENSYDANATLIRKYISTEQVSSIFNTGLKPKSNMGSSSILFSDISTYNGGAYYFENGNHKLVLLFYGDNLWKNENKAIYEFIKTSLSDLKGPQEFTYDTLK